jgi:protein TonB
MKKICLLFVAMFCTLVMFAQSDGVNTTSNDTVVGDDQFTAYIDPERNEILLTSIQVMPEFPGGQKEMCMYIQENLIYPKQALKKQIQGRSICQFIVEKDGSISHIQVVRSSGNKSLDRAAIRVIKTMPKWTPGRLQGKIVRTTYALPVNFRIPNIEK